MDPNLRNLLPLTLFVACSFLLALRMDPDPQFQAWRPVSFTITGLAICPDGYLLAANEGRQEDTDYFRPEIISILPGDDNILRMPNIEGSVQGLTVTADGSIWFAEQGDNSLRNIDGGREIDRIEINRGTPNGLLWRDDTLIVSYRNDPVLRVLDSDAVNDASPISRIETDIADPDQLAAFGDCVAVLEGQNGGAGEMHIYGMDGSHMESYELPEITAIEGAVIEGDKLLVAHDGAFHDVIPSDNMIASYNLPYDAPSILDDCEVEAG